MIIIILIKSVLSYKIIYALVIVSVSPASDDVYLFSPPEVDPELHSLASFPSIEKLLPCVAH